MPQDQQDANHLAYRADIDGLRAIAVLGVIVFHAFPGVLSGGFVGVDVFFVISGFLISGIIFKRLDESVFSFSDFYLARIRRIFPALILVFLTCFFIGWNVLLQGEYRQLSAHVVGGSLFSSNFILWSEIGYFDNVADTKPLLHLWSLGIEEQFYLVWPVLVWLLWHRKKLIPAVVCVVILVSFATDVVELKNGSGAAFYSPFSRFWELLGGVALAWLYRHQGVARLNAVTRLSGKPAQKPGLFRSGGSTTIISLAGVALLVGGMVFLGRGTDFQFPGAWALVPVCGAMLIIAAGQDAYANRRILSNPVLVWFGLISYPLYLWHWPLLSLARIVGGGTPPAEARFVLVLIAIVLAWLTYRFVERPIRTGTGLRRKSYALVSVMFLVCCTGLFFFKQGGVAARAVVPLNSVFYSGDDGGAGGNSVVGCGTKNAMWAKIIAICEHDKRGKAKFALLGDSKAGALYPGLVRTSDERGRWLILGGKGLFGSPVPLITDDPRLTALQPMILAAVDTVATNSEIEEVVIVSAMRNLFQVRYHNGYMKDLEHSREYDVAFSGFSETLARLQKAGKKVIIVVDNPALPDATDCVARRTNWSLFNSMIRQDRSACFMPYKDFLEYTGLYRKLLVNLKAQYPDTVEIFDPTDVYCDMGRNVCGPKLNGRMAYSGGDHISDYVSGIVGKRLNELLYRQGAVMNQIKVRAPKGQFDTW